MFRRKHCSITANLLHRRITPSNENKMPSSRMTELKTVLDRPGKSRTWLRRWQILVFPVMHFQALCVKGLHCSPFAPTTNATCRDESISPKEEWPPTNEFSTSIVPSVVMVDRRLKFKHRWSSRRVYKYNFPEWCKIQFHKRSSLMTDFSLRGWALKPAALFKTRDRK